MSSLSPSLSPSPSSGEGVGGVETIWGKKGKKEERKDDDDSYNTTVVTDLAPLFLFFFFFSPFALRGGGEGMIPTTNTAKSTG